MQKRLLALVAMVAMVLSMFAGVAFAAEPEFEVKLNKTKVIAGFSYELVTGTVVKDGKLYTTTSDVTVTVTDEDDSVIEVITTKNGRFEFYVPKDIVPQDITVKAEGGDDSIDKEATIEVRYNVTTTPSKLEFPFVDGKEPVVIKGKVTDSENDPVKGLKVTLTGAGAPGGDYFDSKVTTNDKGEFSYVVLEWEEAGEIHLELERDDGEDDDFGPVSHVDGEILHKGATVSVSPNTGVVHSIVPTTFDIEGSGFKKVADDVEIVIKKGSTEEDEQEDALDLELGHWRWITADPKITASDGKFSGKFEWLPKAAGTYTLVLTAGDYKATTTISVVNPANYNLLNSSDLKELEISETNDRLFGINAIELVDGTGATNADFVYTIYVDGKVAKNIADEDRDFEKQASGTINIKATKLTTHSIRVVVHLKDDSVTPTKFSKVFDQTYAAKVVGWDVTIDPAEVTVNEKQDIVVVVKDEDGKPVNNAAVKVGSKEIEPGTANVQNGTYVFKDMKFTSVGTQEVSVTRWKDGSADKLMATLSIDVVGEKAYSVVADVETLLQGTGEDVKLTVTKGSASADAWRVKWIYEDDKVTPGEATLTSLGDDVYKAKINAKEAGTLVVRVENIDGTLCGETTIEVVAPKLVLVDEDVVHITNNFKTAVSFKVVDPRDDSVIEDNLEVERIYVPDDLELYDADDSLVGTTLLGAEEHALIILPKVVKDDWDEAKKEDKVVSVGFKVGDVLVDGVFEVKDATIVSDPEMIVVGAKNNLTLTYLDANGQPIEGKVIKAADVKIDETDENGQVIYPAGLVVGAVEVTAETDTDELVKLTIKAGYDYEAPQVTYEVDGNKAIIIVTDNVRLARVNIDGKDMDFWPGARYEHAVTLQPGVNKFRVKAQDSNDNVLDEVVEIEPETKGIVLKDEKVERKGEFIYLQARQFEELGAVFAWDDETKTATFTVDENTVSVTIGSDKAIVNGEEVTMEAVPYLATVDGVSRTYVHSRFVATALGWKVHWQTGDIITITK